MPFYVGLPSDERHVVEVNYLATKVSNGILRAGELSPWTAQQLTCSMSSNFGCICGQQGIVAAEGICGSSRTLRDLLTIGSKYIVNRWHLKAGLKPKRQHSAQIRKGDTYSGRSCLYIMLITPGVCAPYSARGRRMEPD